MHSQLNYILIKKKFFITDISSSNNNALEQSSCEASGSEINAEVGDKNTIPESSTTHLEKNNLETSEDI